MGLSIVWLSFRCEGYDNNDPMQSGLRRKDNHRAPLPKFGQLCIPWQVAPVNLARLWCRFDFRLNPWR